MNEVTTTVAEQDALDVRPGTPADRLTEGQFVQDETHIGQEAVAQDEAR